MSAPAGFGKTTQLVEWLAAAQEGWGTAWLSLDRRDNDATLFWRYVVAALNTASPGIGVDALALLQSSQPPMEAVLTTLLNDLQAIPVDIVLVLDDYHVIDARDVQDGVMFLLEHLPPQIHLVIATRADPSLPLARLRGRGDLAEIRAADLRFSTDETEAYLNGMMRLALTSRDAAALEAQTEGWIAALQLVALSLQGRDDTARFVADFAGDDRYIVDYLVEEVLQSQPGDVQNFLLQTSILERLSGSLCDAVTGQDNGQARLAALDRGNLFVVPLDARRHWYRYHQLFADVLQARLLDEQGGAVPDLHRRASFWYEQNGGPSEAIGHALAARDFERAADLVELEIPAMRRDRQEATLYGWLKMFPEEVVRVRPVLGVGFIGALVVRGELEGVDARLREVEGWLEKAKDGSRGINPHSSEMVVVDAGGFRRLPSTVEVYRAALALAQGDVPGTVRHAQIALELAPAEDDLQRAAAAGFLGLASWTNGALEAGHQAYADCMAGLRRAGHLTDTFGCAIALADIRLGQARLDDAMRTYEQALQLASEQDGPVLRGTADMYVGLSDLHRERGDLESATQDLLRSRELGEHSGLAQNPYRWRVAMARIREAEGDLEAALELFNEAERLYVSDFFPNVRPVPASKARVLIALGRLAEASRWAAEQGLSVDDDLSYLHEFEHCILARLLLARFGREGAHEDLKDAARLLERLLGAAETGARTGSVIEILVLQSLARQAAGDLNAALDSLHRALRLAEPEGYIRTFVDEGPPMAALLRAATKTGVTAGYARQLVAAMDKPTDNVPVTQGHIEPLSERELDVLRLLGSDLEGPHIARELCVSLNTLRTHTSHIYAKLGVNSRRATVRRGEELDLLSLHHRQSRH
ncbi:LuxR C-terminal-related transcriptional regulator [Arthrobacter monumenti]